MAGNPFVRRNAGINEGDRLEALAQDARSTLEGDASYTTIDKPFAFSNGLVAVGSIILLSFTFAVFERHTADFDRKTGFYPSEGEPAPCQVPTPDINFLGRGVGLRASGAVASVSYEVEVNAARNALCSPRAGVPVNAAWSNDEAVRNTLRYWTKSDEIRPEAISTGVLTQAQADASVELQLCLKNVNFEESAPWVLFGDLQKRIARAYMHAEPAFYRYIKSRTDANDERTGCLGTHDPFGQDGSPAGDAPLHSCLLHEQIHKELADAARDDVALMAGAGYTTSATVPDATDSDNTNFPKVGNMLYRLIALSVIGHYDRTENGGKCFQNVDMFGAGVEDVVNLCQKIYSSSDGGARVWSGATRTVTGSGTKEDRFRVAMSELATTCDKPSNSAYGDDPYPPPPPVLEFAWDTSVDGLTPSDVQTTQELYCAESMAYGLFDSSRLFGIPDVQEEFVWNPRNGVGLKALRSVTDWLAGILYWGTFGNYMTSVKQKIEYETAPPPSPPGVGNSYTEQHYPKAKLRFYVGYRLAGATFWGSMALSVAGYALAYTSVPSVVLILTTLVPGQRPPVKLKRPKKAHPFTTAAAIVGVLIFLWLFFVDPSSQAPYPVTTECNQLRASLGANAAHEPAAYETSWSRDPGYEGVIAFTVLILSVWLRSDNVFQRATTSEAEAIKDAKQNLKNGLPAETDDSLLLGRDTSGAGIKFFTTLVGLASLVASAVESGHVWAEFSIANEFAQVSSKNFANVVVADCVTVVWAALFWGFSVGSITQKWVFKSYGSPELLKWTWTAVTVAADLLPLAPLFTAWGLYDGFRSTSNRYDFRPIGYAIIVGCTIINAAITAIVAFNTTAKKDISLDLEGVKVARKAVASFALDQAQRAAAGVGEFRGRLGRAYEGFTSAPASRQYLPLLSIRPDRK